MSINAVGIEERAITESFSENVSHAMKATAWTVAGCSLTVIEAMGVALTASIVIEIGRDALTSLATNGVFRSLRRWHPPESAPTIGDLVSVLGFGVLSSATILGAQIVRGCFSNALTHYRAVHIL